MKILKLQVEELTVHILTSDFDAVIALTEAQHRGTPLGGPYSAQHHRAHTTPGENHIHVYHKNNQLFALNASGTAHDRSHGIQIPNKVAKAIKQTFSDIRLPPNNYIESVSLPDEIDFLLEPPDEI